MEARGPPFDAAAELEHRRLDQLQHQASALSSACDELLSDTSQRSQQLQALSQVRHPLRATYVFCVQDCACSGVAQRLRRAEAAS